MPRIELDPLLNGVSKPARYSGGEWNSIVRPWDDAEIRWALIYPDVYDVGMSNGGLAILYDLLNHTPRTLAERAFAPWPDMEASLRAHGAPLFSLENRRPLGEFDALGFSLSYELTYTNLCNMLDLAGIAVLAAERADDAPIVFAGGSGALVPEPLALVIDAFILGEGEDVILEVTEVLRAWKSAGGGPRVELLRQLARTPGVYVPRFYRWHYGPDGTVAEVESLDAAASLPVVKRFIQGLPPILTTPIVPFLETVHDRAGIEIQRGCTQGCRFCQAGMIYRPLRERTPEEVVAGARELLANTGYDELSLVSLSSTDHSQIDGIVAALRREFGDGLGISLPSTRVDSFSVDVAMACAPRRRRSMTFAPEAGSQRLRNAVSKVVADEDCSRRRATRSRTAGAASSCTSWWACPRRPWTTCRASWTGRRRSSRSAARWWATARACASRRRTTCPRRTLPSSGRGRTPPPSSIPSIGCCARAVAGPGWTSPGTTRRSRSWRGC